MSASSFAPIAEPEGDPFVAELLSALRALARGEFAVPPLAERAGPAGEVTRELNRVIELQRQLASELWRVSSAVGNGNLTERVRLEVDARRLPGDFRRTACAVNDMVEQLASLARAVTPVASGQVELEGGDRALAAEARQLAPVQRYNSQFLANLSHELRTPLNSLLILSKMLLDNVDGNLSTKQVAFCQTIHASGNELLARISDILDLARIEAGTLALESSELVVLDLQAHMEQAFRPVARQKGLEFAVEVRGGLPPTLFTDAKRLQQILKHLLSNAFKFTERGKVSLSVAPVRHGWSREHTRLNRADVVFAFSVTDTGAGVPDDEQGSLFDVFAQLAGPGHRRSGGTGLGLSISHEVARLLGGELRVVSAAGRGSTFTCYLPSRRAPQSESVIRPSFPAAKAQRSPSSAPEGHPLNGVGNADASARPAPGELILIAESDELLSQVLFAAARQSGLEAVTRLASGTDFAVLTRLRPVGIVLDVRALALDGWVMLDRLGQDPSTRHVPVVAVVQDAERRKALSMGAVSAIGATTQSDIDRAVEDIRFWSAGEKRRLLLADWTLSESHNLSTLLGVEGVEVRRVSSLEEASSELIAQRFHAVVLALGPGARGHPLLEALPNLARGIPTVLYVERALEREEAALVSRLAEVSPLSSVSDLDQLSIDVCKSLHRAPPTLSKPLTSAGARPAVLGGVRVLIIDDDVRNIFAMTSALERHGALVSHADTAREGLELFERGPPVQALIVDVATPDLGGHDIIRRVRQQASHAALPIIAITAEATPADRDACARSGATHCIAKPVDAQHIASALRVVIAR